ncbi:MAG: CpaD family pilus assembly lipoprotein [Pseudomonadota bacterium]
MLKQKHLLLSAALSGLVLISGCQSDGPPSNVPAEYFTGTTLDRNAIGVTQHTEHLEVRMDPRDTQLRIPQLMKIQSFLDTYRDEGHGPLVISMPRDSENDQLAVGAVAEIRQLAWEAGVAYEEMLGAAYNAGGRMDTPIVMAFKIYKAQAPECLSLAEQDVTNAISNSDLPSLGCAVRTNMAAMIAEPADLLGQRELDEGDLARRGTQLQLWREGDTTAAVRTPAESAVVSGVIQ